MAFLAFMRTGLGKVSVVVFGAALALGAAHIVGAQATAAASGCSSLNGQIYTAVGGWQNGMGHASGFKAGDVISVSWSVAGQVGLFDNTTGTYVSPLIRQNLSPLIYTVPSNTTDSLDVSVIGIDPSDTVTVVCATALVIPPPTPASTGNVLSTAGQASAGNSNTAINNMLGSVVDGTIGNTFNPFTASPNGMAMMVAPGQQGTVTPVADAPIAQQSASPWRMFAAGRYTHASGTETGDQINGLFGVSRRFGDAQAIGLFGGYESFSYTDAAPAQLSGSGGTFGAFLAGQITPRLTLDARGYGTLLNYNITQNGGTGSTSGQRFAGTVSASYELGNGPVSLKPFVRGTVLTETDAAYTDSLGNARAAQSFTQGIIAHGGKLSRSMALSNGATFTPYISGEGSYAFGNSVLAGFSSTSGFSGKASIGANLLTSNGVNFGIDASYGGIGSTINSQTLQGTLTIPF